MNKTLIFVALLLIINVQSQSLEKLIYKTLKENQGLLTILDQKNQEEILKLSKEQEKEQEQVIKQEQQKDTEEVNSILHSILLKKVRTSSPAKHTNNYRNKRINLKNSSYLIQEVKESQETVLPSLNLTYQNNSNMNYSIILNNSTLYAILDASPFLSKNHSQQQSQQNSTSQPEVYNYFNITSGKNQTLLIYNNTNPPQFQKDQYDSYMLINDKLIIVYQETQPTGNNVTQVLLKGNYVNVQTYQNPGFITVNDYYNQKIGLLTFTSNTYLNETSAAYRVNNGSIYFQNITSKYLPESINHAYYTYTQYKLTNGSYYNDHANSTYSSQNKVYGDINGGYSNWFYLQTNGTQKGGISGGFNNFHTLSKAQYSNGQQTKLYLYFNEGTNTKQHYQNILHGFNGTSTYESQTNSIIAQELTGKRETYQNEPQVNQFISTNQFYTNNATIQTTSPNATTYNKTFENVFHIVNNYTYNYSNNSNQFVEELDGYNNLNGSYKSKDNKSQGDLESSVTINGNNQTYNINGQLNSIYSNISNSNVFNNSNTKIYKLNNSTIGTTQDEYDYRTQYNSYQFENGQNNTQTENTEYSDNDFDIIRNNLARSMFFMTKEKRQSGGWQEMNVQEVLQSNTEIVSEAIAEVTEKFAPREEGYEFDEIVSIHEQIVAGFNYNIKLRYANEQGQTQDYQVFIYSAPWTRQPDQIVSCEQLN